MRYLIGILLLLSTALQAAPTTTVKKVWLDKEWNIVTEAKARYYLQAASAPNADGMWPVKVFYKKGNNLRFEGLLKDPTHPESSPSTGPYKYFYGNGVLESDGARDKNGNFTGPTRFFDNDGTLTGLRHFANDKTNGEQIDYWPNGTKSEVYFETDGKRQGKDQSFFESGKLQATVEYKDDKKQGEALTYFESGQIKTRELYRDGKREGESKRFNSDGQLLRFATYMDGKLDGDVVEYRDDGSKRAQTTYVKGKREGFGLSWDEKGQLASKIHYHNDVHEGEYWQWQGDGQVYRQFNYHNGKQAGKQYTYYRDSKQVSHEEDYSDDGQVLVEISYDDEGNKRRETHYDYSEKQAKTVFMSYKKGKMVFKRQKDPNKHWQLEQDFDENGTEIGHLEYQDGDAEGDFLKTDSNWGSDTLWQVRGHYHKGKLDGPYKKVTIPAGVELQSGVYQQGNKVGEWHYQDENSKRVEHYDSKGRNEGELLETTLDGKLLRREHYHQNQFVGDFENRDKDGRLLGKGQYKNGKREGDWQYREVYDSDKLWQGRYQQGNKVGIWRATSQHGYLLATEQYDNQGRQQGKFYEFEESGLLSSLSSYHNGQPDGKQIDYVNGKPYRTTIYKNGDVIDSKTDDNAFCLGACDSE